MFRIIYTHKPVPASTIDISNRNNSPPLTSNTDSTPGGREDGCVPVFVFTTHEIVSVCSHVLLENIRRKNTLLYNDFDCKPLCRTAADQRIATVPSQMSSNLGSQCQHTQTHREMSLCTKQQGLKTIKVLCISATDLVQSVLKAVVKNTDI